MINLKEKNIAVISLGCDKNRVDTEKMLGLIDDFSNITDDPLRAHIIIINTCAFLESARKEAIETIFEFNTLKKQGQLEKLVVTGCLPQKFIDDIYDELPEVDVFLGFKDYDLLFTAIQESYKNKRVKYVNVNEDVKSKKRFLSTPLHYAYLKIADGCNNHCTYCLIPSIRGKYKSTPIEQLIEEASSLGELTELILVAQDVTRYGIDLYGRPTLVHLIQELSKLNNIGKIRLLYCYPDMITDELINEFVDNDKLIKYIDIPLQHADASILKLMNRKGDSESYLRLINQLKSKIDGISIRTTFITGFPGETEEAHINLKRFLERAQFFNAGFFVYSKEEGTASYKLPNHVAKSISNKRCKELYTIQKKISQNNLLKYKNKIIDVVFDEIDYDKEVFVGRPYFFAPDIDGKVYFTSSDPIQQGNTYKVKITKTSAYDLYGSVINEFTE